MRSRRRVRFFHNPEPAQPPFRLLGAAFLSVVVAAGVEQQDFSWRPILYALALRALAFVGCAVLCWLAWASAGAPIPGLKFLAIYSRWFAAWLLIFSALFVADAAGLRFAKPRVFAQVLAISSSGQDTRRLTSLAGPEGAYAIKALVESDRGWSGAIEKPGMLWIGSMAALRTAFTLGCLVAFWAALRSSLLASNAQAAVSMAAFLGLGLIAVLAVVLFQMRPIMVDPGLWLQKWAL